MPQIHRQDFQDSFKGFPRNCQKSDHTQITDIILLMLCFITYSPPSAKLAVNLLSGSLRAASRIEPGVRHHCVEFLHLGGPISLCTHVWSFMVPLFK